jgi:hypothetical protein
MQIGIPQALILFLMAIGIGIHMAKHGERRIGERYNALYAIAGNGITIALLWWGGFFQ